MFEYRGLYYHEVFPNLFCGSQPTCPEDVSFLNEHETMGVILSVRFSLPNHLQRAPDTSPQHLPSTSLHTDYQAATLQLQHPKDQEYWGVDPAAIEEKCTDEDIVFLRISVRCAVVSSCLLHRVD